MKNQTPAESALCPHLTRPGPHVGGHTRRSLWWVTSHHLHGCGRGQAMMTPLPSLLHTPTSRPNAASTPAQPSFSSMALPLALEPWPIDSETLACHWTIGHPLPPPEPPTVLWADQFWVRSDLLALRSFQNHPVLQCSGAISMQCAHQSGVHCQLSSPTKWLTVYYDFQPPCICHPWFLANPCPSRTHSF